MLKKKIIKSLVPRFTFDLGSRLESTSEYIQVSERKALNTFSNLKYYLKSLLLLFISNTLKFKFPSHDVGLYWDDRFVIYCIAVMVILSINLKKTHWYPQSINVYNLSNVNLLDVSLNLNFCCYKPYWKTVLYAHTILSTLLCLKIW